MESSLKTNPKTQLDLVNRVIPKEYTDIMSSHSLDLFCKAFLSVVNHYKESTNTGYRCNASKILYPKLKDLHRPYTLCKLETLKAIILTTEPYINGEATGVPFEVHPEYPPKYQLPETQQSGYCLDKCIKEELIDTPYWFGVNWPKLLESGVLVIHTALTSESDTPNRHYRIWYDFTKSFLLDIHNYNNKIPVLMIGEILRATFINLPKSLSLLCTSDAYYLTELAEGRLIKSKVFSKFNKLMESNGFTPINFKTN